MPIKTIGITGSAGQLGIFCRARLQYHFGYDVRMVDRAAFQDDTQLTSFVDDSDVIVHLAGINRGTDEQVRAGNPEIAQRLVDYLELTEKATSIVYASTTQIERNNIYGRSKLEAGQILKEYCNMAGSAYSEMILPNLFGEYSKPFYNNVTGTFCHAIANGHKPPINDSDTIELLHYSDAADAIAEAIASGKGDSIRPQGHHTNIVELAETIQAMHEDYTTGVIPDLRNPFALKLFNAYRQNLFPDFYPFMLTRHADSRGSFFECIREKNGGQISFSTTLPGVTRGEHFHFFKVERFLVLSGKARISMRPIYSEQRINFDVSGDAPCFVDMPTLYTHNITNIGDSELLTLFWTHEFFNPDTPDTYPEKV